MTLVIHPDGASFVTDDFSFLLFRSRHGIVKETNYVKIFLIIVSVTQANISLWRINNKTTEPMFTIRGQCTALIEKYQIVLEMANQ